MTDSTPVPHNAPSIEELLTVLSTPVETDDYTVTPSDLPPQSLAYVLRYGLTRAVLDAGSLTVRAKDGLTHAQVAEKVHERRMARLAAILRGEPPARERANGPNGSPSTLERMERKVAIERVQAGLAAAGLRMPKGNATVGLNGSAFTRDDLIRRQLTIHGAAVREEAERRVAAATHAGEEVAL